MAVEPWQQIKCAIYFRDVFCVPGGLVGWLDGWILNSSVYHFCSGSSSSSIVRFADLLSIFIFMGAKSNMSQFYYLFIGF